MDTYKTISGEITPTTILTGPSIPASTPRPEETPNRAEKKRKRESAVSPETEVPLKQSRHKIERSKAEEAQKIYNLHESIKQKRHTVKFLEGGLQVLKEYIEKKTEEMEKSKNILLMLTEV